MPIPWTATVFLVVLLTRVLPGAGWTQDELDLFDLVEEVGENFYDLIGVDQVKFNTALNHTLCNSVGPLEP